MKRIIIIALLVFLCTPAYAVPNSEMDYDRDVFKSFLNACEKQKTSYPVLDFKLLSIGNIGYLPAIVTRVTSKDGKLNSKEYQREDFEFEVEKIIDANSLIVRERTLQKRFWLSGISTAALADEDLLGNLHPVLFNKIFFIAPPKSYGSATFGHITCVPGISEAYAQCLKDIKKAKAAALARYEKTKARAKKRAVKEIKEADKRIKKKYCKPKKQSKK